MAGSAWILSAGSSGIPPVTARLVPGLSEPGRAEGIQSWVQMGLRAFLAGTAASAAGPA